MCSFFKDIGLTIFILGASQSLYHSACLFFERPSNNAYRAYELADRLKKMNPDSINFYLHGNEISAELGELWSQDGVLADVKNYSEHVEEADFGESMLGVGLLMVLLSPKRED